jgi:Domain of unknown function (DUF1707)
MSASRSPLRTRGPAPRSPIFTNPDLRISDADRTDVTDRLARHYGDGRLDQAEFNERLDQALRAKTQSDLHGLFTDLPPTEADAADPVEVAAAVEATHRRRRRGHSPHRRGPALGRLLFLGFIVVVTAVVARNLVRVSVTPWLLIALLAFAWLRVRPRRR